MATLFGLIIFIVGFILLIGNITGWWPTFFYAGFIIMSLGITIIRLEKESTR